MCTCDSISVVVDEVRSMDDRGVVRTMKWCMDCKRIVVTTEERHSVTHRHLDGCPIETWYTDVCSECGSDDLVEPTTCRHCGQPMNPYSTESPENVCEDCLSDINYALSVALKIISKDNQETKEQLLDDMRERLCDEESIRKIINRSGENESTEEFNK